MRIAQGGENKTGGFTIVETIIVLAVTGALLTSALLLVNGQQNKTQFQVGIRQAQQQIQQVANEAASGYFPNSSSILCRSVAAGVPPVLTGGSKEQGTNTDCIFLGKFIQFGVDGTDPEAFEVLPIIGNRLAPSGLTQVQLPLYDPTTGTFPEAAEAGTTALANVALGTNGLGEARDLDGGITSYGMKYTVGGVSTQTGTVGFLGSLAAYKTSVGGSQNLASGSQQISLYAAKGTALHQTVAHTVTCLYPNGCGEAQPIIPVDSVQVCLASGGTSQSGMLTIGGNDGSTNVTLKIFDDTTCGGF